MHAHGRRSARRHAPPRATLAAALAALLLLPLASAAIKRGGYWEEDPLTVAGRPDLAHMPVRGQRAHAPSGGGGGGTVRLGAPGPTPAPPPPAPRTLTEEETWVALGEVAAVVEAYKAAGVAHPEGLVGPAAAAASKGSDGVKDKVAGSVDAAAALAKLKATSLKDAATCKVGWGAALAAARLSNASTVVEPGSPAYPTARAFAQVVNEPYNYQALPAAIVYAGSEADVAAALKAAVDAGCRACARAGGHDTSGASTCAGGVLIDVTRLKGITLHGTAAATIQAGVRFGQMEATLGPAGLGAVTGLCPDVGLAGYSLGGGWGVLSKEYGFGLDNVLAYRVALTDGRLVTADEAGPHADLFWALRGAGHGNFGIVTAIEYRTFVPPPAYTVANITWPLNPANRAAVVDALDLYQADYLNQGPASTSFFLNFGKSVDTREESAVFVVVSQMAANELEDYLAPFVDVGGRLQVQTGVPWVDLTAVTEGIVSEFMLDGYAGPPVWEYKLGAVVDRALTKSEWGLLVDGLLAPRPDKAPYTLFYLEPYEGRMLSNANATSFVHRQVGFDIVTDSFGFPGEKGGTAASLAFLKELYGSPKYFGAITSGQNYQNYPNTALLQPKRRALDAFYGDNVCALVNVKKKYDPTNVFATDLGVPPHVKGC